MMSYDRFDIYTAHEEDLDEEHVNWTQGFQQHTYPTSNDLQPWSSPTLGFDSHAHSFYHHSQPGVSYMQPAHQHGQAQQLYSQQHGSHSLQYQVSHSQQAQPHPLQTQAVQIQRPQVQQSTLQQSSWADTSRYYGIQGFPLSSPLSPAHRSPFQRNQAMQQSMIPSQGYISSAIDPSGTAIAGPSTGSSPNSLLYPDRSGGGGLQRSVTSLSGESSAAEQSDLSRSRSPSVSELSAWGRLNTNGTWSCSFPGCNSRTTFTRGCDLRKHYKRHSKIYFCRVEGCSQASSGGFSSKKDRLRHEARHDPKVACEVKGCPRIFSRIDNMKDHVRRKHSGRSK